MINQSSNKPILVFTSEDLSEYNIRANLSRMGKIIKVWNKEDMIFHFKNGKYIIELSLEQRETKEFEENLIFEIKWIDSKGYVQFAKQVGIHIHSRNDKEELTDEPM